MVTPKREVGIITRVESFASVLFLGRFLMRMSWRSGSMILGMAFVLAGCNQSADLPPVGSTSGGTGANSTVAKEASLSRSNSVCLIVDGMH